MDIWENRDCQANNNPTVNLNQLGILKNAILPSEETFFSWNRTSSTGKIHPPTRFPRKGNLVGIENRGSFLFFFLRDNEFQF